MNVCVLLVAWGLFLAQPSDQKSEFPERVRLGVPSRAFERERHTTLLSHFERKGADADYARTFRANGGSARRLVRGRFGHGVVVDKPNSFVLYEGLDNINTAHGTVEFWAKSAARNSIWSDGQTHWLLAVYPERAQFEPAEGMAPYHLGLFKSAENELVVNVVQKQVPRYELGTVLQRSDGWRVQLPVGALSAEQWHHVLVSYSLKPPGRLMLVVDGEGISRSLAMAADAPWPNPAYKIIFGGMSGEALSGILSSNCVLDELRIRDIPVEERSVRRVADPEVEALLLQAEDAVRGTLDRFLALQRHGGWHDFYQWPSLEPAEWGWIGRGVNMWFSTDRDAGELMLRAWRTWGDDRYRDAAADLARMYMETQLANGGWNFHYAHTRGRYIPFSKKALIAQEMQTGPVRYLAFYAGVTGDSRALASLRKATDFFLATQGAGGWWGWRATESGPSEPPALNDEVTTQAIQDLFVIYWTTKDERCLQAINRAVEWILAVQLGPPTYGWAEQYDESGKTPAWNRDFEPPAVSTEAISCVAPILFMMYDITGEERYLSALRRCLAWLRTIPDADRGWLWYDIQSQKPIVAANMKTYTVDDPVAKQEILPKYARYGLHYQWPDKMIAEGLEARDRQGPLFPANADTGWQGGLSHGEWTPRWRNQSKGWAPRKEMWGRGVEKRRRAEAPPIRYIKHLRAWLNGVVSAIPVSASYSDPFILAENLHEGRQFQPMEALRLATRTLDWIDATRTDLGDSSGIEMPLFDPRVWGAWVYAHPRENLYSIPLPLLKHQ